MTPKNIVNCCFKCLLIVLLPCTLISQARFRALPSSETGITFGNFLEESSCRSVLQSDYIYNGGGVAIGDLNGDNLQDIFLIGNFRPNKLYLNQGELRFEDITEVAGIAHKEGWDTGVTMADVNADGRLDIYICRQNGFGGKDAGNLLLLNKGNDNKGIPQFEEQAVKRGISNQGNSAHGTFFDYDLDGDLDLFVLNYLSHAIGELPEPCDNMPKQVDEQSPEASNHLYQNDGRGFFKDVTEEAGLKDLHFGLSATVADFNQDGAPDIFVANDYNDRDMLYINRSNGTFQEVSRKAFGHISRFSMGSDAGDLNNDGLLDLLVVDMVSGEYKKSRTNMGAMRPEEFWNTVRTGHHYQYMSNCLQLNNGQKAGDNYPTFQEIGQLAGIAKTDWSWAALFADLDNDGWKDIIITNGIRREIRNNDLGKTMTARIKAKQENGVPITNMEMLSMIPEDKTTSFIFKNNGDYTFKDVSKEWGFQQKGWSNGLAYADLDNDFDLDLVLNNIDAEASVFRNMSAEQGHGNAVRIAVQQEEGLNPLGFGATVQVYAGAETQSAYIQSSHGFYSSSEPILHFGIREMEGVDSVRIRFPDKRTILTGPLKARTFHVFSKKGSLVEGLDTPKVEKTWMQEIPPPDFQHRENDFDDYSKQVLLPHGLSAEGPAMAHADVNGDGKTDLFFGGAAGQSGQLYLQTDSGNFEISKSQAWKSEKHLEDVVATFVDVNGDGAPDLYIGRGGNEWNAGTRAYQDQLFLNDGEGNFSLDAKALPEMPVPSSSVQSADFDKDGDLDLFVGGRHVPGAYPLAPRSYLLRNEGGKFSDVTADFAPELMQVGMVTCAEWVDFDGDTYLDLVIAGEWMSPMIFKSARGKGFRLEKIEELSRATGLWYAIVAADVDGDGDADLVAGNLGLNSKFKAPLQIYSDDFDANDTLDIVLAYENKGVLVPVRGRQCSSEQIPGIRERFVDYEAFASADLFGIYGSNALAGAKRLEASVLKSLWFENRGKDGFIRHELPVEAQFAPVRTILVRDFTGDGHPDILLAGNDHTPEVETVRYDAGIGLLLRGDGTGGFSVVSHRESGFFASGDVRSMIEIVFGKDLAILVLRNNDKPLMFKRE